MGVGVTFCLFLLTGFISVTVASDLRVVSPAGPKLCERLCHQTVGCSSFRFSSEHLSCHLLEGISPEDRSDGIFTVKKNKADIDELEGKNCPSSALVFLSNKKYFICRPKSPIHHGGSKSPIHHGGSKSPIHLGNKSPIHHGGSKSPIHHSSKLPIHHGGSKAPIHHGGSKSPIHHGGSKSPIHHCGSISPIHHDWKSPIHHGGSKSPIHHGSKLLSIMGGEQCNVSIVDAICKSCSEVAFMPTSEKLVIRQETNLILASLRLEVFETVTNNIFGGFGIAEERIYFFKSFQGKTLCSMSPYGRDLKLIARLSDEHFIYIAVDIKRKQVYIGEQRSILVLNYEGRRLNTLEKAYAMVIIPVNSDWAFAFNHNMDKVFRMSLEYGTERFFVAANIDWMKDRVCITGNKLFVINEKCEVVVITESERYRIVQHGGRCLCFVMQRFRIG